MQIKLIALAIIVMAMFPLAFAKNDLEAPAKVVDQYCTLDYNGARLTSNGMAQISKLASFKGEPGWDSVVVSESYCINSSRINGDHASVQVQYSNFGDLAGTDFNPRQTLEIVIFKLKRSKEGWKITSPLICPHVSKNSIVQNIQTLIANEGDSKELNSVLSILKALK